MSYTLPQMIVAVERNKRSALSQFNPNGITKPMVLKLIKLLNDPSQLVAALRALPLKSSWKRDADKLAAWIDSGMGSTTPFTIFAEGNSKLPFYSFSTLPLVTCPGKGECGTDDGRGFCYSMTAWRYPAALFRQIQNTLLIFHRREVLAEAFNALPADITFRLYVDGDFDSLQTVRFWMEQLTKRPDVSAYGYSKSWELLVQFYHESDFPLNYKLNLSSGSKYDHDVDMLQTMQKLPCTRGRFVAVATKTKADYTDKAVWRQHSSEVLVAAKAAGYGKVFVCPGRCGECNPNGHACGQEKFIGITIAIGVH